MLCPLYAISWQKFLFAMRYYPCHVLCVNATILTIGIMQRATTTQLHLDFNHHTAPLHMLPTTYGNQLTLHTSRR